MPRPPAPRMTPGHVDHQGRHRRGREVQQVDVWDEWQDEAVGPEAETEDADPGPEPEPADAGTGPEQEQENGRVRVLTVPESLRSVDVQVGARAVRGLLLLAAVVLLVLGGRWWWVAQGAGAEPVPLPPGAPQAGNSSVDQDPGGAGAAGPEAPPALESSDPGGGGSLSGEEDRATGGGSGGAPGGNGEGGSGVGAETGSGADQGRTGAGALTVVVHVVGEVRSPGVVELAAGSRVADAVEAAGGLTEGADQASLNLARALVDGEQVWVGAPGEEPPPAVVRGAVAGPGGGSGADASGDAPPTPLDLNLATQADLEELPGIGPVTAGHILAWRDQHGRFSVVEELMEVSGIGERTFAQLQPLVTVGG